MGRLSRSAWLRKYEVLTNKKAVVGCLVRTRQFMTLITVGMDTGAVKKVTASYGKTTGIAEKR